MEVLRIVGKYWGWMDMIFDFFFIMVMDLWVYIEVKIDFIIYFEC